MCCMSTAYKKKEGMTKNALLFEVWHGTKWLFSGCTMQTDHVGLPLSFLAFQNYPNTIYVLCAPDPILME